MFRTALATRGLDVGALVDSGTLVMLDAAQTLAAFMRASRPDPALFEQVVGGVLAATAAKSPGGHFYAYGEMVDLLWRDGNPEAAIALEELWNGIGERYSFSLLCAYAMSNFGGDRDTSGFAEVCRAHSRVVPTETYLAISDPEERLREVSLLQQRARALENEVLHRKRVEAALRDAVSARDDFLCVAGHELRTPLSVLRLQLASLLTHESTGQDPRTERRLATLAAQTERLARLAERLVDASQLSQGLTLDSAPFDLAELVREVTDGLVDVAAAADCPVTVLAGASVVGRWDRDRIEQALLDLLSNAFKFGRGAPVRVVVKALPDRAQVVIRDGGVGLRPEDHERVFARFERAAPTRNHAGLGLGLWFVRQIAEAHGGSIEVSSSAGAGATFTLSLPYGGPPDGVA
jgi:signal transduction histidine kinase